MWKLQFAKFIWLFAFGAFMGGLGYGLETIKPYNNDPNTVWPVHPFDYHRAEVCSTEDGFVAYKYKPFFNYQEPRGRSRWYKERVISEDGLSWELDGTTDLWPSVSGNGIILRKIEYARDLEMSLDGGDSWEMLNLGEREYEGHEFQLPVSHFFYANKTFYVRDDSKAGLYIKSQDGTSWTVVKNNNGEIFGSGDAGFYEYRWLVYFSGGFHRLVVKETHFEIEPFPIENETGELPEKYVFPEEVSKIFANVYTSEDKAYIMWNYEADEFSHWEFTLFSLSVGDGEYILKDEELGKYHGQFSPLDVVAFQGNDILLSADSPEYALLGETSMRAEVREINIPDLETMDQGFVYGGKFWIRSGAQLYGTEDMESWDSVELPLAGEIDVAPQKLSLVRENNLWTSKSGLQWTQQEISLPKYLDTWNLSQGLGYAIGEMEWGSWGAKTTGLYVSEDLEEWNPVNPVKKPVFFHYDPDRKTYIWSAFQRISDDEYPNSMRYTSKIGVHTPFLDRTRLTSKHFTEMVLEDGELVSYEPDPLDFAPFQHVVEVNGVIVTNGSFSMNGGYTWEAWGSTGTLCYGGNDHVYYHQKGQPLQRSVEIPENPWRKGMVKDDDWRLLEWWGWYHVKHEKWHYHLQRGWYRWSGNSAKNLWIYEPDHGWYWTHENVWPVVWTEQGGWQEYEDL